MKRSVVYVDGFNLYYGAVRGTPYKWLDLQLFFERLRQDDDVQAIRYFTAMIEGPHAENQRTFLRALSTRPKISIHLGRYKRRTERCRVRDCHFAGDRTFRVFEEKRTDVHIALAMLDDAYRRRADRFILVSGDSDLVPAVNLLRERFPECQVIVYVPAQDAVRGAATELRAAATAHRTLPMELLKRCQFPARMPDGVGGEIVRPPDW